MSDKIPHIEIFSLNIIEYCVCKTNPYQYNCALLSPCSYMLECFARLQIFRSFL